MDRKKFGPACTAVVGRKPCGADGGWSEGDETPCETRFEQYAGPARSLFLSEGDRIAVISPSSFPDRRNVDATLSGLRAWGYVPVEGRYACGEVRTLENCLEDLKWALEDPDIKAVFCVRGGYGGSQVMDRLPKGLIGASPKLIIGYSDITVFHAAWTAAGIPSVHGSMSAAFTELPEANAEAERRMLRGEVPVYTCKGSPYDRTGEAEGILVGGNLSTFMETLNTAYDCTVRGFPYILFLEDDGENISHLHHYLTVLKHFGVLDRASGILLGEWTKMLFSDKDAPDGSSRGGVYVSAADMISREFTRGLEIPMAFGFPAGHGGVNWPLLMGAKAHLAVTDGSFRIEWPADS